MCLSQQERASALSRGDARRLHLGDGVNAGGEIRVMCQCALPVTERLCNFFTRQGVTVVAVMDDWFIAKGSPENIEALRTSNLVAAVSSTVSIPNRG